MPLLAMCTFLLLVPQHGRRVTPLEPPMLPGMHHMPRTTVLPPPKR
jgi:hypothetical protein